ncbi:MAG: hypothetical protein P1U56_10075 [Saprospiraceae bacterium]|nr:hypothetical protein [Saprospiraceae bacterium]
MNIPRVFDTFSSFSSEDWKQFSRYSCSTFPESSPMHTLLHWIINNKKTVLKCTHYEEVRHAFDPKLKSSTFTNLMTKVTTHSDDFIAYQEFLSEKSIRDLYILKATARRGLEKSYDLHYKKLVNTISKNSKITLWSELHKMQAAHFDYYYNLRSDPNHSSKTFEEVILNFKRFIGKLSQVYSLEMLNRSSLLKEEKWKKYITFFDPIYDQETEISIYMDALIHLIEYKNDNGFDLLYEAICSSNNISNNIKYILFTYVMSYILYDIKENGTERMMESFQLYNTAIEEDFITNGKSMSYRLYLNVLDASCNAKEFEWSQKFIEKWATRVDPKNKKAIVQLGEGYINFYRGNFDHVIQFMYTYEHPSHALKVRSRWLHLCASFETYKNDYPVMKSIFTSFLSYLKSNKVSITSSTASSMTNSVRVMELLIGVNKEKKLKNFLESEPALFGARWLKSKITEKF